MEMIEMNQQERINAIKNYRPNRDRNEDRINEIKNWKPASKSNRIESKKFGNWKPTRKAKPTCATCKVRQTGTGEYEHERSCKRANNLRKRFLDAGVRTRLLGPTV
jgi:hypothetical protein